EVGELTEIAPDRIRRSALVEYLQALGEGGQRAVGVAAGIAERRPGDDRLESPSRFGGRGADLVVAETEQLDAVLAPAIGMTVVTLAGEPDLAARAALGRDLMRLAAFRHRELDRIAAEFADRRD